MSEPAYVRARNVAEALAALADAGPQARCLAGGTDLMVELHTGRTAPDRVIDLWRIDELRGTRDEQGGVRIGALTTCASIERSPIVAQRADVLVLAAREVGAEQIRQRATVGGNLGTASPAADLNPVLLALGAHVRLVSARGAREVAMEAFFTGYRQTARRTDELIESVWIPPRPPDEQRRFRKVGTRRAQSIAKVAVALAFGEADGRFTHVTAGVAAMADRVVGLPTLARLLTGVPRNADAIAAAIAAAVVADVSPIDDVRSTAEYRRHVLARVLARMLLPVPA